MFASKTIVAASIAAVMVAVMIPPVRAAALGYGGSDNIFPLIVVSWLESMSSIFGLDDSDYQDEIVNVPNYAAQRRLAQKNQAGNSAKDCVKESGSMEITDARECCAGLKQITAHGDSGLTHVCVSRKGQKAGGACIFDADCQSGMKCQRLENGKEACVDIQKQKEGASCTFDDDCAAGYYCDRSGWDNTCKKTPACAKSGQTVDRANEQKCCSGLKMVPLANAGYQCVNAADTEETRPCTFDSDCPKNYFCYQNYQCRKKLACAQVGEVLDYENGKECCSGLESIANYRIKDGDLVLPSAAQNICAKCGDGTCGNGENGLNCAMDCPVGTEPESADNSTEYLQSTAPFGKAMLQPGQCQEINCVGNEREINGLYKCNGRIIGKIVCGNESDSNSSGYGSAEGGYTNGYLCCGQQGSSGGGSNGASTNRTSPNIKYEPLNVPVIEKCANEGETLTFFSNQKCCAGLRSIFAKIGGNPAELCIKNHGQEVGQPCDDHEDCRNGLVCSYSTSICSRIDSLSQ